MDLTLQTLKQFGLREKEATVYMASLSAGTASIATLAKKAHLKRPTMYLIVDELIQKGFLVSVPRGKKLHYKSEDPEKLNDKIESMRRMLDISIEGLKKLYEQRNVEPKITFYNTKEGIYSLYERMFRSKEIWAIWSPEKFYAVFSREDIQHFFRLLDREKGKIYDIFENNKIGRQAAAEPHRFSLSTIRFLQREVRIATDILISQNAVAFISFETLIGVLIEDKNISASIRLMIQALWEKCEIYE